jgi:hypothetical protein
MANINIATGILPNTQIPLDSKVYAITLAELTTLGLNDNLAYAYQEGLIVYCIENEIHYQWREIRGPGELLGLVPADFTYPAGIIANGISYGNRTFNFFIKKYSYLETEINLGDGYQNENGTYTWVMYAEDIDGNNMTSIRNGTSNFVGWAFNQGTTKPKEIPSLYIWIPLTNEPNRDGIDGSNGIPGLDGLTGIEGQSGANANPIYFHIAYADDADGNGFTHHPFNKKYVGTYVDYTAADSEDPDDYYIRRNKFVPSNGISGFNAIDGLTYYLHIAYANSSDGLTDFDLINSIDKTYIGTLVDQLLGDSPSAGPYDWTAILDPNFGIDNGTGTYTWIKYNNDLDGLTPLVDDPEGQIYRGFAFNQVSPVESLVFGDYEWHLIHVDTAVISKTSQLINDGQNGIDPFITEADLYSGNQVIIGNYYNIPETYQFYVQASKYIINENLYTNLISDTLTLDVADGTFDRIDRIVINDDETFSVLKGEATATASPLDLDELSQVHLTFILVQAATTEPGGGVSQDGETQPEVTTNKVYDENTGEPDEWTISDISVDFDPAYASDSESGALSINSASVTPSTTRKISFTNDALVLVEDLTTFIIRVKIETIRTDNRFFRVRFSNETSSAFLFVNNGMYGFDKNLIYAWQTLIIPAEDISIISFKTIELNFGTSDYPLRIDNIVLQGGLESSVPPSTSNVTKTSELINDGENGVDPFITLADTYNGNVVIIAAYTNPQDYDFNVEANKYIINNTLYESYISDTISLSPAHATLDRIDTIVINNDGTFSVLTGTPSTTPFPSDLDELTQVKLTFVLVTANTTSVASVTNEVVYNENLGSPSEWNLLSATNAADTDYTLDTQDGAKSIHFPQTAGRGLVTFDKSTYINISDITSITFKVKFLVASTSQRFADFIIADYGVVQHNIQVKDGNFGLDGNNIVDWQSVTIDANSIISITKFNSILINGVYDNQPFLIDNIAFQGGLPPIDLDGHVTKTSEISNDGADGENPYVSMQDFFAKGFVFAEGCLVRKANGNLNKDLIEIGDEVYFKSITNAGEPLLLMGHTYNGNVDKQLRGSYVQNNTLEI